MSMKLNSSADLLFLKSALTRGGAIMSTERVVDWLLERNRETVVRIEACPVSKIPGWYYDDIPGRIRHHTGKFFSIDGININTTWSGGQSWQQPIINQPEIDFLGIITKEINGVLHFLLQTPSHPVPAPRLGPTRRAPLKSNFLADRQGIKLLLSRRQTCLFNS